MERIAVIGSCGAGKSRLSRLMAERLGLPIVHLDRLLWKPGWVERPRAEFEALQSQALPVGGRWIADGNYSGTMPLRLARADTIVFLDFATHTCLLGALQRLRAKHRPDMTEGCVERLNWDYLSFLNYVLTFRRTIRPRILQHLSDLPATTTLIRLHNRRAVEAFLSSLRGPPR